MSRCHLRHNLFGSCPRSCPHKLHELGTPSGLMRRARAERDIRASNSIIPPILKITIINHNHHQASSSTTIIPTHIISTRISSDTSQLQNNKTSIQHDKPSIDNDTCWTLPMGHNRHDLPQDQSRGRQCRTKKPQNPKNRVSNALRGAEDSRHRVV
mmetsp:Transcript_35701/g.77183  ORF Transcript_35701/g.77183 Transcript_35701/m.77183 type:complete len:156 (+) Transcript_35701:955-1422(+)